MKLIFVSNMLNHHQMELCRELQNWFSIFYFVVTESVKNIGYQSSSEADYVLHYYNKEEKEKIFTEIVDADAVIFGGCPNELIELRMNKNKLCFIYSERFFKKGTWRRAIPKTRKSVIERVVKYKTEEMYVLCSSAYLSYDLSLLGFPESKCFKWGYFPKTREYSYSELMKKKKHDKVHLLWAGRMLKWKHPDDAIRLADNLSHKGIDFCLNIIGDGDLKYKLSQMIKKKNLEHRVHLLGSKNPEQVRKLMEEANIYLLTSDRYEGWGAVLNEAMNSGCAVVSSHAAGATPYLICNEENGLIYKSGSIKEMTEKVELLISQPEKRAKIGYNAYVSISQVWNARVAAQRFYKIVDERINGNYSNDLFADGPCSLAELLNDKWFA